MRNFATAIFLFIVSATFGQGTDEALANQYFSTGEYAKAADLYEKLLKKSNGSVFYYSNLLTSYLKLGEEEKAIKLTKEQQKRFPDNVAFKVDEIWIYSQQGNSKAFNKALDELFSGKRYQEFFVESARALSRRGLNKEAIRAYGLERKNSEQHAYSCEVGELQLKIGNRQEAVNEYLNCFQNEMRDEGTAQTKILEICADNAGYETVKKELIKRIQANSNEISLTELLVKAMVQREDYSAAFLQIKALDKRLGEDGRKAMDFANILIENGQLALAEECMEYVIKIGPSSPQYLGAIVGKMNIAYKRIESGDYDEAYLARVEKSMLDFLKVEKGNPQVIPIYEKLGSLYLFYFHDAKRAIDILEPALNMKGIRPAMAASIKLLLGDAYVAAGDPWEAQLYYGQVDKDFKEDLLGQEAKFRNARLSFYMGEFEWATAQLEVLKTATSQLISNDAIELALIIQENSGYDSTDDALFYYAQAAKSLQYGRYDLALQKLDSLDLMFPNHSLGDEVLVAKAEIYIKRKNYEMARTCLEKVIKIYGNDILADKALIMLGKLYEEKFLQTDEAFSCYQKILLEYPGSIYTSEARSRARKIKAPGKTIN